MAIEVSPAASHSMQERLREREFYKYFEPLDFGLITSQADLTEVPSPVSATDVALKAFAQLGAIRLNARRSMISLFSRDTQYIVAEATRTLSLQKDTSFAEGDSLWIGCTAFPRTGGICQYTVGLPPILQPTNNSEDESAPTAVVIGDLTKDERFHNHPAVVGSPFLRFYAGVPIRTASGLNIGSYCILDDEPRDGIDEHSLELMKDISASIFMHLENKLVKQQHRRSEKMVRGVGAFIEGKASMQESWTDASNRLSRSFILSDESSVVESPIDIKSPFSETGINPKQNVPVTIVGETNNALTYPEALHAQTSPSTIKTTFGRASNIIREAIEVDGVVFLDATVGSFAGYQPDLVRKYELESASQASGSDSEQFKSSHDLEDASDTGEKNRCHLLGLSTTDTSTEHGDIIVPDSLRIPESVLRSLLRKYSRGRAFILGEDEGSSGSESETKLKSIRSEVSLANLDKQTDRRDSSISRPSSSRPEKMRKQNSLNAMMSIFANAKSLIFYPLWDLRKERWFAGAIAWSNKPTRLLTEAVELNYLASFSNSVMAEIARLDAIRADRTKTDFISSISHELRSPLHGILGSVEVMQDTSMDQMQDEMVRIIDTCGRTLLDTFNHLLEYAKINNFTRNKFQPNGARQLRRRSAIAIGNKMIIDGVMSLGDDIDLSNITEEVVQTMSATADHLKSSTSHAAPRFPSNGNKENLSRPDPGSPRVMIILDIDALPSWVFRAPSGAWRRALMNVVGNSLKYTSTGYIHVRLQAKNITIKPEQDVQYKVSLIITDSGKGMSREYIRDRLFTPFAQEDSLTPGTGLGLSIVGQIVKSLGGSVNVSSQKGKGTEVKINFKFGRPAESLNSTESEENQDQILSIKKKTKGLKVKLLGFGEKIKFGSRRQNDLDIADVSMSLWRISIERLCTDWFEMTICTTHTPEVVPDLIIWNGGEVDVVQLQPRNHIPTIIIHQDVSSAYRHMYSKDFIAQRDVISCISQPVGPIKLAKALESYFKATNVGADGTLLHPLPSESTPQEPITPSDALQGEVFRAQNPQHTFIQGPSMSSPGTKIEKVSQNSVAADRPEVQMVTELITPQEKYAEPLPLSRVQSAVLLVDDNDVNLRLLTMAMKKIHMPYITATNGLEAFEAYKASAEIIQHIFMDISMPVMDGMQSSREIRQFERQQGLRATKIIALTGLASASAKEEAHSSGIDLFLTKPVMFRELKSIITGAQTP